MGQGSIRRSWVEFWGRNRGADQVEFPEDVIIMNGFPFTVSIWTGATFMNLPPATAAVITSPDGQRLLVERGGYLELPRGVYLTQYVDLHERTKTLPKISATTSDGFTVTLSIIVSYQVTNPALIMNVDRPIQAFYAALETAVKNYIISHTHDEVIKTNLNDDTLDKRDLENYIRTEVGATRTCEAFHILNMRVQEWQGDAKNIDLRKSRLIQEKENLLRQEQIQQKQNIVEEEQALEQRQARVTHIKAEADADRESVIAKAQELKNNVMNIGKLPERRHAQILQVINAIKEMPGFPRNATEAKILQELTTALLDKHDMGIATESRIESTQQNREEKISDLSKTILDMLNPKRSDGSKS
jgi:regulator of protease activity HflC (stomatin/prohibitin superfamily)